MAGLEAPTSTATTAKAQIRAIVRRTATPSTRPAPASARTPSLDRTTVWVLLKMSSVHSDPAVHESPEATKLGHGSNGVGNGSDQGTVSQINPVMSIRYGPKQPTSSPTTTANQPTNSPKNTMLVASADWQ